MNDKPFLSIREAAEHLGVEYKTVYRLVTQGELPAGKVGGQWRIRVRDLERYFEEQVAQARQNGAAEDSATAPLHCGHCRQIIPRAGDVAGHCQALDCDEPLCARCWGRDERFCRTHTPSADDRLRQAEADRAAGVITCLVPRGQARERELNLLRRLDYKMRRISVLRSPFDGIVYRDPDWEAGYTTGDEVSHLLDLVGTRCSSWCWSMPLMAAWRIGWPRPARTGSRSR